MRRNLITVTALLGLCGLASNALAQNGDRCDQAIPVSVGTTPFDSTNFATDMQVSCTDSAADIFFIFTPTATGRVTIDTCGSSFDTVLATVLDCAFDDDCNDDACGITESRIDGYAVNEGISFFIRVGSFGLNSTGGAGELHINYIPSAQWDETLNGQGDAGDLPSTAQIPTGTDPFTEIAGEAPDFADADLYLINICDVPNFTATTFGGTNEFLDTRLALFDANGFGVTYNDDVPLGFPGDDTLLSRISGVNVPSSGNYYLAVSFYANTPLDGFGNEIWVPTPYGTERIPDGPGSGGTLASWDGGAFDLGAYVVTMTGVCFAGGGPACDPDVNQDGNVDQGDVDYLINVVAGGENTTGIDPDFNRDGNVDQGDIDSLINVVAGANCP